MEGTRKVLKTAKQTTLFKNISKTSNIRWNIKDNSLNYGISSNFKNYDQIAMFDMDGTLIKTKSGKKFAKDENDWEWLFPEIKPKLKELAMNNFSLIIASNQLGVSKGKVQTQEIRTKIEKIQSDLGVDIAAFFFNC